MGTHRQIKAIQTILVLSPTVSDHVTGCTLRLDSPVVVQQSADDSSKQVLILGREVTGRDLINALTQLLVALVMPARVVPSQTAENNAKLVRCGMDMGFAPTWLRQVSPPPSTCFT